MQSALSSTTLDATDGNVRGSGKDDTDAPELWLCICEVTLGIAGNYVLYIDQTQLRCATPAASNVAS